MIGERPLRRDEGLEIVVAILAAAGAATAPVGIAGRDLGAGARCRRGGIVRRNIVVAGTGSVFDGTAAGIAAVRRPIRRCGIVVRRQVAFGGGPLAVALAGP